MHILLEAHPPLLPQPLGGYHSGSKTPNLENVKMSTPNLSLGDGRQERARLGRLHMKIKQKEASTIGLWFVIGEVVQG
eukprot:1160551-Pelagomonas_calceolata.AAC.6